MERRALRRVQRRRPRRGLRSEGREGNAEPLDRARDREGHARGHRGDRAIRFNEAAGAAYRFVWNVYCDWYVELSKPLLTGPDGAAKDETRATAAWALDEILKLLHPFMPFITEELWRVTAETGPKRDALLVLAPWPKHDGLDDAKAEAEIGWLIDLVTAIRSVRVEMNIPPATPIPVVLAGASAETKARAEPLGRVRQAARARRRHHLCRCARRRARCNCSFAARSRRCRSRA